MITIRNTNERYGMPITFTAETEHDAATAMETAIQECFPGEAVQITSDDYEIVPPNKHSTTMDGKPIPIHVDEDGDEFCIVTGERYYMRVTDMDGNVHYGMQPEGTR